MLRRDATIFARAFAPGHVTGIFAPARSGPDPRARGSVGAGIVLELGVHAAVAYEPVRPSRVVVRSAESGVLPISTDVAQRLLGGRRGRLTVDLRHELPIGQGFGMSAAGALATALACGRVLGHPRGRAVSVAHLADLFGGGGLGGVSALLGGGLEVRTSPGVPPWGAAVHRGFPGSIWLGVVGSPMPSPRLLSDPGFLERVTANAEIGLRRLTDHPDPATFFDCSERFSDHLALSPPELRRVLARIRGPSIRASQAMFGRSFFAVAADLSSSVRLARRLTRLGVHAVEIRAAVSGARLMPAGRRPSRETI